MAERVEESLAATGRGVLYGPWGTGKTTLVRAVADHARQDGRRVLRLSGYRADRHTPYSALVSLLGQLQPDERDVLPDEQLEALRHAQREALPHAQREALTHAQRKALPHAQREAPQHAQLRPPTSAAPENPLLHAALTTVLSHLGPRLLVVDDAQWLDDATADALSRQLHILSPDTLQILAAERGAQVPTAALRLCADHPTAIRIPPWTIDDIAHLLSVRGLPTRAAGPVHRLSGGNPVLTLGLITDVAGGGGVQPESLTPSPLSVHLATGWYADLSRDTLHTLRLAALATAPSPALLRRAGRTDADTHLAAAAQAGVLTEEPGGSVIFTADLLRDAALAETTHTTRVPLHEALSRAEDDPVEAVRHRLLAHDDPDAATATQAEEAACSARAGGDRALAAELLLLAADRTPVDRRSDRLHRLAAATDDARASARPDLAHRVHEAVRRARPGPAEHVSALLAVVFAVGQDMEATETHLSRARQVADGDPALLADVEYNQANLANISGADSSKARDAAARAAVLAGQVGDHLTAARALTMQALMERVAADPTAAQTLSRALALNVPLEDIGISDSPRYQAVRFAIFDDRLGEAREELLDLLSAAERGGDLHGLCMVLRSLVEIAARSGDAAKALSWSDRYLRTAWNTGISLGPAWYVAAVAQAAGGSFEQAVRHAALGLAASREDSDALFISRNLAVTATVHLVTGDGTAAVGGLRQVARIEAEQGTVDPRILRWQPDMVEALATVGELHEAEQHLAQLRSADPDVLRAGVGAATTRAQAVFTLHSGDAESAAGLFAEAAEHFAALGLVLEHGRTLISQGRLERSRRRVAAARALWQQAQEIFVEAQARPWVDLSRDLLHQLERPAGRPATGSGPLALSEAELRLARIVAAGASNQEAANRLFLSVKTIEAMLSRVYRKLSVRGRTQLAQALRD
ncbi:AAA family ATPase [Streptomyces sp. NPDC055721]|uniref:helix-turn-helix transcriptional regulator n=1 Tax=Streptomyces sp. NPDC127132 TaxID=3345374 RepID=UPI0036454950